MPAEAALANIEIDGPDAPPLPCQRHGHVKGCCRLSRPALLIPENDHMRHVRARISTHRHLTLCGWTRNRITSRPVAGVTCEERGVAAGGGGVDGVGPLQRKAEQVVRPARLGAGAGEAFAAERLHAHDRADLVAVDVHIPDPNAAADEFGGVLDAGMDAERKAVTGRIDRVTDLL